MIRCGAYLRQSIADDDLAVSRQWDEIIEKICRPRGWEAVKYVDNDTSAVGEKRNRPEFERLLRDMEAGQLQAVACWDLDRLYREPIDLERIIPLADRLGIAMATVTGDVDLSTDNGRLFARIKGAVAKAETERRSERQRAKYRQLAEAGRNTSPRRSFGRLHDGSPHPVEAPALAEAYELVLAGHSLTSIINDWNKRGIRTSLGNRWGASTQLNTVLRNPRNAGLRSHNRKVLGEGGWEPIVPVDVWRAVAEILADPSRRPTDTARRHLLTGIMQCAECAPKVVGIRSSWTSHKDPISVYQCKICFRVLRAMAPIDDYITELTVERLSRPDAAELFVDRTRPDVQAKRIEADALRERLKSLALLHAEGEVDDDQLRAGSGRIKEKLIAVEHVIEDANRSRLFKGVVGDDARRFASLHLDRRRAIIDSLMIIRLHRYSMRLPWNPDTIEIEWRAV